MLTWEVGHIIVMNNHVSLVPVTRQLLCMQILFTMAITQSWEVGHVTVMEQSLIVYAD